MQAARECVLAETKEAEKVSRQKEALSPKTLGHNFFVQNHTLFGDASKAVRKCRSEVQERGLS